MAWWLAGNRRAVPASGGVTFPKPSSQAAPQSRSIAVLPFSNLGPDKADEYLSDGLTEELINVLVRIPGLRVPARTSSFVFKDKKEDIRKIGELLNVQTVLEGSLRRSSNRIRVTAQLINVADGFHLWSENYDHATGDMTMMQDEIARQIAARLRLDWGGQQTNDVSKRVTRNPEAHELYLKGLYFCNKRTKAGLEQGHNSSTRRWTATLDSPWAMPPWEQATC